MYKMSIIYNKKIMHLEIPIPMQELYKILTFEDLKKFCLSADKPGWKTAIKRIEPLLTDTEKNDVCRVYVKEVFNRLREYNIKFNTISRYEYSFRSALRNLNEHRNFLRVQYLLQRGSCNEKL